MTEKKKIIFIIIALILAVAATLGLVISCIVKFQQPENPDGGINGDGYYTEPFISGVYNPTRVGFSAEYLGTVSRRLPGVSDGGLSRYPKYGVTLSGATEDEKNAIIAENSALCASATTYDGMDADGNLYLGGVATGKNFINTRLQPDCTREI